MLAVQAMAAGIPCILPYNSANKTLCDKNFAHAIPAELPIEATYPYETKKVGVTFSCLKDDVKAALKEMTENYSNYLAQAQKNRAVIAEQYSVKNGAIKTIVKPEQVELGDTNTIKNNTLVTNSRRLYEKYLKIHI
jgi:hypothetical protein